MPHAWLMLPHTPGAGPEPMQVARHPDVVAAPTPPAARAARRASVA